MMSAVRSELCRLMTVPALPQDPLTAIRREACEESGGDGTKQGYLSVIIQVPPSAVFIMENTDEYDGQKIRVINIFYLIKPLGESSPSSMLKADALAYSAVMRACAEAEKHDQCMHLLHEMQTRGLEPASLTLTACVLSYAKTNRMGEADDLLQSFRLQGVEPNLATWQALLLGHALAGDSQRFGETLIAMREAGVAPRCAAQVAAWQSQVVENLRGEAARLLGELRGVPSAQRAVMVKIVACAEKLQWQDALRLIEEMMIARSSSHVPVTRFENFINVTEICRRYLRQACSVRVSSSAARLCQTGVEQRVKSCK